VSVRIMSVCYFSNVTLLIDSLKLVDALLEYYLATLVN